MKQEDQKKPEQDRPVENKPFEMKIITEWKPWMDFEPLGVPNNQRND